eukprot:Plantae.Rhodophyta-Hildenbrandia_rubra.ctg12323.p1 GENE.Plantae.Rhodophyta-Hildenbrandia_rubra.ctg12323~~Plantae.Rhodophyta-Hildenbrandia_rubra.ctg12323.p1  ORF type:complete len:378 (-),score=75.74 Plantae.Rhodophyta-Hildenbrandia_rubra.ctg12323:268-1401(-)
MEAVLLGKPPTQTPADTKDSTKLKKVTIIGSGNWGSAASMIVGRNALRSSNFDDTVRMWVYEEQIDGKNLTEIINETHENVKYLPGKKLPPNIVAVPDLIEAVKGSTALVFVIPHQFLERICKQLKGKVEKDAVALSLIKGIDFDEKGPLLMSSVISDHLNIDVSVLSGANIAHEIASGQFCESTIGYNNLEAATTFYQLFNDPHFRVSLIADVAGVQVFGALKNVVALGAGFCDALDMGSNTKAALIRIGLIEIYHFAHWFFKGINEHTMVESCGMADLITTCMGGRNRKVAEAFGRSDGQKSWDELEKELLNGQKLQGTVTCLEVHRLLKSGKILDKFPLFERIHKISFDDAPLKSVVDLPMENLDALVMENSPL